MHEDGIISLSATGEIIYRGPISIQEANTTKQTIRERIISFFTNHFFRFMIWRPARITIQLLFIGRKHNIMKKYNVLKRFGIV
jgi:hypothetical protein